MSGELLRPRSSPDGDTVRAIESFANAGDNVQAFGSFAPLAAVVGLMVIQPDGSRYIARVTPDPLAQNPD